MSNANLEYGQRRCGFNTKQQSTKAESLATLEYGSNRETQSQPSKIETVTRTHTLHRRNAVPRHQNMCTGDRTSTRYFLLMDLLHHTVEHEGFVSQKILGVT